MAFSKQHKSFSLAVGSGSNIHVLLA